jgi:WD40 repeat protein/energy-coupling factor transporter ATP-binding protein EcfA2
MPGLLPADLVERVLASHPLPIADATGALVGADSAFEQRDRVVEVFRAALRTLSALALAARVQLGKGPGAESSQIPELIRSLRSRGLTDGQWFAIVREMLRPWAQAPASYPLPELVSLIHGKKSELPKLVDELLAMRKSETVAHGASGTKAAIAEILERRAPQLARLLALLAPLWERARLVVPLARPDDDAEPQAAWLLMGYSPPRGKWRRVELHAGVRAAPGEALLVDADGKPVLALHPLVIVRRPSPDAIEEVFVLDGGTKKGAAYVALPSMAEHRETEAWSALSRALSDEEAPPENPGLGAVERPFRGLSSFGPEHAALFFGREEQAEAVANRIRRNAFLTVTGPSGSGKTSLLRAGALPTLTDHAVALLRPGAKPLEALAARIADATGRKLAEAELLSALRADPSSLGASLAAWSRGAAAPPASAPSPSPASPGDVPWSALDGAAPRIAIIVDQTEEMLTLCHDDAEREAFAAALVSAGASADGPSRVVLSVREDFFGRLATVAPLRGIYSQTVEVVTTPDREALARTLYLPAKQFGYTFEDEPLVTEMVDAVASEPAALALLQFCADRLWEGRDRTWDAYRALGGVTGALAAHADRVLAELSPAQQKACRGLFLRLVTPERTRAVVARRELLESAASKDDAEAALDRLIAGRLLTAGEADDGGETRVELVHEALVRHWGALAAWLDEDVEGQRLSHALRQAAREWQSRDQPRGLLWRGDALADIERFRRRATDRLTGEEAAFLAASVADERRGARIRRGLGLGAFAATAAFAAFIFFEWRAAVAARVEAERQRERAEVRGLVSEARTHEPAGRLAEALALMRAASALEEPEKQAGATPVSLDMERLEREGAAARVLAGHTGSLTGVLALPGGARLATASRDGAVRLWDAATGALALTLPGTEAVVSITCSADGKTIATARAAPRGRGAVQLWDAATGAERKAIALASPANHAALSPDGKLVATGSDEDGAALWNAETGALVAPLGAPHADAEETRFSPDGSLVLVRTVQQVSVHAARTGALVASLAGHERPVLRAAFSHSGAQIATTSADGTMRVWETATGKEIARLAPQVRGYDKPVTLLAVAFSPDDRRIAVTAIDGSTRLVDPASGAVLHTLLHATASAESVAFSPDGTRVVTASRDHTAAVWDAAIGALVRVLGGHQGPVSSAVFLDDHRVATASDDRTARVWDIATGPLVRMLAGHTISIERIAASKDGALVVSASLDKTASVWDVDKGAEIAVLGGHQGAMRALAITGDGQRVVTSAGETPGRLWDARTGAVIATLEGEPEGATTAAFSHDGKLLVTGAKDGSVRIRDGATGVFVRLLPGPPERDRPTGILPRRQEAPDRRARRHRASLGRGRRRGAARARGRRRRRVGVCRRALAGRQDGGSRGGQGGAAVRRGDGRAASRAERPRAGDLRRGLLARRRAGGDSLSRRGGADVPVRLGRASPHVQGARRRCDVRGLLARRRAAVLGGRPHGAGVARGARVGAPGDRGAPHGLGLSRRERRLAAGPRRALRRGGAGREPLDPAELAGGSARGAASVGSGRQRARLPRDAEGGAGYAAARARLGVGAGRGLRGVGPSERDRQRRDTAERDVVDAVTVQDIAARAQIDRATFYLHCKDKDDLVARWPSPANDGAPGALPVVFCLVALGFVALGFVALGFVVFPRQIAALRHHEARGAAVVDACGQKLE